MNSTFKIKGFRTAKSEHNEQRTHFPRSKFLRREAFFNLQFIPDTLKRHH